MAAGPAEFDPVNSPSHYVIDAGRSGMVECKDVVLALTAMGMPHYAASAFEYLWRAGRKDDLLVDLKKARRDLDMQIEHIEDSRREASE